MQRSKIKIKNHKNTESVITEKVMERVVDFEKKKSRFWLGRFLLILFILFFTLGIILWFVNQDLVSKNTYDLFSLFSEDKEIIAEYWQDTVMVIWEEMPQEVFIWGVAISIIIFSYLIISRKKLKLTRNKLYSLDKYEKTKIIEKKGK